MVLRSAAFVLLASWSGLLLGSPALAQDGLFSPRPTADTWAGFHIGVFGGWAWADIGATELVSPEFGFYIPPGDPYDLEAEDFVAGGQAGYDWQWGHFLAGVEGEIGRFSLRDEVIDPNSLPTGAPTTSFESKIYGAFTGRVGVVLNRMLVYAKGGLAVLDASGRTVDLCGRSFCGRTTIDASNDDVLLGWTLGGGVEVALSEHWSFGGEYQHLEFDDLEVSGIATPAAEYSQDMEVQLDSVRAFLKYRW